MGKYRLLYCTTATVSLSITLVMSIRVANLHEYRGISGMSATCAMLLWLPPDPLESAVLCPPQQRPLPVTTGTWPKGATWIPENVFALIIKFHVNLSMDICIPVS